MNELLSSIAPWAALTFALWFVVYAIRRWFPRLWSWMAWWPEPKHPIGHVLQALPTTLLGAVLGGLSTGDVHGAAYGALAAAVAPLWHHVLKAAPGPYRGSLSDAGKRLDDHARKTLGLLLVTTLILCSGCGKSLEEARTAGLMQRDARPVGSAPNETHLNAYCRKLDNQRTTWGAIAAGAGVVSGGSGISSIPLENDDAKLAAQSAAVGALVIGGVAYYVQSSKEAAWARDCSER